MCYNNVYVSHSQATTKDNSELSHRTAMYTTEHLKTNFGIQAKYTTKHTTHRTYAAIF